MHGAAREKKWGGSSSCARKLQRGFPGLFLFLRASLLLSLHFFSGASLVLLHQPSIQPLHLSVQPDKSLAPSLNELCCSSNQKAKLGNSDFLEKVMKLLSLSLILLTLNQFFLSGSTDSSWSTENMRLYFSVFHVWCFLRQLFIKHH